MTLANNGLNTNAESQVAAAQFDPDFTSGTMPKMKKKKTDRSSSRPKVKTYCSFCGSTVGQTSDHTGEKVNAVYDCPKCNRNYCDQCSYEDEADGLQAQFCLRCESRMEKVM